jgi:EmrB/QacA subfamily drug resistance transporter
MSERKSEPSRVARLGSSFLAGYEPAPAQFVARQPYYPWLVVATACMAGLTGQLDASIVQLILPTLEHDFAARLSAVSLVAVAYTLASGSSLPVLARLAAMTGRKLMFLGGFLLFMLASAMCGLATNLTQLIAFRTFQGIGGAMLAANSLVILIKAAGPSRQGRAIGIFAAIQAIGVTAGPAVGGALLAALSWRWVFWVNVPLAFAAAAVGWFVIPRTTDLSVDLRFDWKGAVLVVPGLIFLLIAINESYVWGSTSPAIIGSAVAAAVLLSAFIWQESRVSAPLVGLDLFRMTAFASGVVATVFAYVMLYGMFFLMSFALVRGCQDPPLAAGLRLAIIPAALGVVAPFTGRLQKCLGERTLLLGGMTICAMALILLSAVLTGGVTSLAGVMMALALYGAGLGLFIAPNNNSTMNAAPGHRSSEASGLLHLSRGLGTSLGVAVASAVLSWRLAALTGVGDRTLGVSDAAVLEAVTEVLPLLIAAAIGAGLTAMLRAPPAVDRRRSA